MRRTSVPAGMYFVALYIIFVFAWTVSYFCGVDWGGNDGI